MASGAARFVARSAADSRYDKVVAGDELQGTDTNGKRTRSRVCSATWYGTFGSAWSYLQSLGKGDQLVPPEWASAVNKSVTNETEAQSFYESLRQGRQSNFEVQGDSSGVRVFHLQVIEADEGLLQAHESMGQRHRSLPVAPAPAAATDAAPPAPLQPAAGESNGRARPAPPAILAAVFAAWRGVSRHLETQARLLLVQPTETSHRVLVRRTEVADAHGVWVLPGADGLPRASPTRKTSALLASLEHVIALSASRADRLVPMLRSSAAVYATRSSYAARATAVLLPMRGLPLASENEQWAWIDCADVVEACNLTGAVALAVRDAVAQGCPSRGAVAASYGVLHTQLGSVQQRVTPPHLRAPPVVQIQPGSAVVTHSARHSANVSVSPAAAEEVVRVALAECADASLPPTKTRAVDEKYINRLVAGARRRALARGSSRVTPRDVAAQAAAEARPPRSPKPSPAEAIPEHYDWLISELRRVADYVARHREAGVPRPRVLIVGEVHGVLASMLSMAGADVATCDLDETKVPHIPHFKGEAKWVRDLGWDWVINHPPCVYLSNAGGMWVTREPDRYEQVVEAAATYRQMRAAAAPFVVTENPKMHRIAGQLTGRANVQYVHPWQHGTGHTKPTGLEVTISPEAQPYAFPPLTPTCVVPGREKAMANLPERPERSDQRSQTYIGIAAAMAAQWLPCVVDYLKDTTEGTDGTRPSADEMILQAATFKQVEAAKACFCTIRDQELWVLSHLRRSANHDSFDVIGGQRDKSDPTIAHAMIREAVEEVRLHPTWRRMLAHSMVVEPLGHSAQSSMKPRRMEQHHVHVWGVEIPPDLAHLAPTPCEDNDEFEPGSMQWRRLSELEQAWQRNGMPLYAKAMRSAAESVCQPSRLLPVETTVNAMQSTETGETHEAEETPSTWRPWEQDRSARKPWTPPIKHVRYVDRRWKAWQAIDEAETSNGFPEKADTSEVRAGRRVFGWRALPPDAQEVLSRHLRPAILDLHSTPILEAMGEAPQSEPQMPSTKKEDSKLWKDTVPHSCALAEYYHRKSSDVWEGIKRLWDLSSTPGPSRRQRAKNPNPGLGYDPGAADAMDAEGLPPLDVPRSADHWRRGDVDPRRRALRHMQTYLDAFRPEASVAQEVNLADAPGDLGEEDIAQPTKPVVNYHRNCLYLRQLSVCRQVNKGRKRAEKRFRIDVATVVAKALGDTGAGPSVITTDLLAQLPWDACVTHREADEKAPLTHGPDGKPLKTHGYAKIFSPLMASHIAIGSWWSKESRCFC